MKPQTDRREIVATKSSRVQIIGDHPHSGKYGVVVAIYSPLEGVLPVMAKIKLDDEPEECFAERQNIRVCQPLRRCFRRKK